MATQELTTEEVVTKILSASQILKKREGNFYISNPLLDTLNDFLDEIEPEVQKFEPPKLEFKPQKYIFIK